MVRDWVVTFDELWREKAHQTALPQARRPHPDGFVLIRSSLDLEGVKDWASYLFGGEIREVHQISREDQYREVHPLGCLGVYDLDGHHWMGRGM